MSVSNTIKDFWDGHFSAAGCLSTFFFFFFDRIAWSSHFFNINIFIWECLFLYIFLDFFCTATIHLLQLLPPALKVMGVSSSLGFNVSFMDFILCRFQPKALTAVSSPRTTPHLHLFLFYKILLFVRHARLSVPLVPVKLSTIWTFPLVDFPRVKWSEAFCDIHCIDVCCPWQELDKTSSQYVAVM